MTIEDCVVDEPLELMCKNLCFATEADNVFPCAAR